MQQPVRHDVFTEAKRSLVMSQIRGRGNKETELALARILRRHGITGWRRHQAIIGRPDFAFPKIRLAVFVDGCFWHLCPKHANMPVGNRIFWAEKLSRNQARDRAVSRRLRASGWFVLRIWEHELRPENLQRLVARIERAISAASRNRVTCAATA